MSASGSAAPSRDPDEAGDGYGDADDATSMNSWCSGDGVYDDALSSATQSSHHSDSAAKETRPDSYERSPPSPSPLPSPSSSPSSSPSPSSSWTDPRGRRGDTTATERQRSAPPPPQLTRPLAGGASGSGGARADSGYVSRSPTSREQSAAGDSAVASAAGAQRSVHAAGAGAAAATSPDAAAALIDVRHSSRRPHTAELAPSPARPPLRSRAQTAAPTARQFADFADSRSRCVSTDVRSARLSTIHAPAWEGGRPSASSRDGSATARDRRQADAVVDRVAKAEAIAASASAAAVARQTSSRNAVARMEIAGSSAKTASDQRIHDSSAALARAAEEWQKKMTEAAEMTPRKKRMASQRSYRTAALIKQASLAKLQASIQGTALKLDDRTSRTSGSGEVGLRPWTVDRSSAFRPKRLNAHVEIHYEKCLPDSKWIECRPKTFVTNHKYGNAYEIRVNRKTRAANPGLSFLWENDCQVWLLEKRGQSRLLSPPPVGLSRMQLKKARNAEKAAAAAGAAAAPLTVRTPRGTTVVKETTSSWKLSDGQTGTGPITSDVFEKFDSWAKESRRRRVATLLIQTHVRRWLVTHFISQLKVTALEKHGVEYAQLAKDYKSLLRRIQRRLGVRKPSAPFGLKEFKQFMERKEAYELAFVEVTQETGGVLLKKNLLKFFNACKFYPLEREVNLAFDQVFRGCGTQADVVILLDSSASVGKVAYDFQLNFIRDLSRHLDLGRDKVRLAVVPYNDNVFGVIDFDSYEKASDLDPLLEQLTYEQALAHGTITRTDVALRYMVDTMEAAARLSTVSREGSKVPKICIAFTDGNCYYTQLTDHWAEKAKAELSVNMFAIAVGKAPEMDELLKIASSPTNVLDLYDYKTLHLIKSAIIGQACLRGCPLCQFSQQQREGDGLGATGRCADERRGLYKSEALELLWMLYPPPAAGLKKYRQSTWMGAMVESNDVVRLTKLRPGDADFRTCLRKAIEDQITRFGALTLPSETGLTDNKYTSVEEAFECIDRLCLSKLPSSGLTNAADDETWKTLRDRSLLNQARD